MTKLSNFLSTEILIQKMRPNPDKHFIQSIQMLMDKEHMTKEEFVNTGRFMSKEYYLKEFVNHNYFMSDVKDVMRYAGGYCIQVLPSGDWMFDTNDAHESDEVSTKYISKDVKEIEEKIWSNYVQKLIK